MDQLRAILVQEHGPELLVAAVKNIVARNDNVAKSYMEQRKNTPWPLDRSFELGNHDDLAQLSGDASPFEVLRKYDGSSGEIYQLQAICATVSFIRRKLNAAEDLLKACANDQTDAQEVLQSWGKDLEMQALGVMPVSPEMAYTIAYKQLNEIDEAYKTSKLWSAFQAMSLCSDDGHLTVTPEATAAFDAILREMRQIWADPLNGKGIEMALDCLPRRQCEKGTIPQLVVDTMALGIYIYAPLHENRVPLSTSVWVLQAFALFLPKILCHRCLYEERKEKRKRTCRQNVAID